MRSRKSSFDEKKKQYPAPEDDASTAEAAADRVGGGEQGEERRANNTSNGEPHLEQGRLRLETWSNMTSRLLRRHGQHIYTYTYCTQCIPW